MASSGKEDLRIKKRKKPSVKHLKKCSVKQTMNNGGRITCSCNYKYISRKITNAIMPVPDHDHCQLLLFSIALHLWTDKYHR